jgi:hypothetical protein
VEYATGRDFEDLFDARVLANYLDDPSASGAGGFPLVMTTSTSRRS